MHDLWMKHLPGWSVIQPYFYKWKHVLDSQIVFSLPEPSIHTNAHCTRVLAYALTIAGQMRLPDDCLEILGAAATFHDSRRQDDWYDVGHGQRAAGHYRQHCRTHAVPFYELTCDIMSFHDLDDASGIRALTDKYKPAQTACLLYRIFKDADALDRFRLGQGGLDEHYLRTEASRSLCSLVGRIWEQYFEKDNEPALERLKKLLKEMQEKEESHESSDRN